MTPAEHLILGTLADVYEHWFGQRADCLGPYGVTSRRLGVSAFRVAEVEEAFIVWSTFTSYREKAQRIREVL